MSISTSINTIKTTHSIQIILMFLKLSFIVSHSYTVSMVMNAAQDTREKSIIISSRLLSQNQTDNTSPNNIYIMKSAIMSVVILSLSCLLCFVMQHSVCSLPTCCLVVLIVLITALHSFVKNSRSRFDMSEKPNVIVHGSFFKFLFSLPSLFR